MKINGSNEVNANIPAGQMGMSKADDPVSKEIQRKIDNAQKQLQELSANTELSMEEKSKRRQEIQREISELNNQLRQHQIDQRREMQQKKEESSFDDMLDGNQKSKTAKSNGQMAGLSQASMESMISADTSMKRAQVQGSVATKMEGRAGVLQQEIKLDSARGGNTERKQAELADVEKTAAQATAFQINTVAEADKAMEEAAKADDNTDKKDGLEVDKADNDKQAESGNGQERSDKDDSEKAKDSENTTTDSHSTVYYTSVDVRL